MTIKFNCEHCGKKIEAPDNAAGRPGKCPGCHNKLQVPQLQPDEQEEIRLAPIDENDIRRKQQLMAETEQLALDIIGQREIPAEGNDESAVAEAAGSDEQLTVDIIMYLRQMADGELDQAEELAGPVVSGGKRTIKILNQIAGSEPAEPELADIPPQVLSALINDLKAKIR